LGDLPREVRGAGGMVDHEPGQAFPDVPAFDVHGAVLVRRRLRGRTAGIVNRPAWNAARRADRGRPIRRLLYTRRPMVSGKDGAAHALENERRLAVRDPAALVVVGQRRDRLRNGRYRPRAIA